MTGPTLRRAREAAGVTAEEVAAELGCGARWVRKLESSREPLPLPLVESVSAAIRRIHARHGQEMERELAACR